MAIRRNIYTHKIDLRKKRIKNIKPKKFAEKIEKIPYRGYEVEKISDGRKIVIVKPGGKQSYGRIRKEDFFVFIYDPRQKTLWQISHQQIRDDLVKKSKVDINATIKILKAFKKVYKGKDPDDFLTRMKLSNPTGELPEALLKAYKWIWGQEDVNYPTGKGRSMSWEGWEKKDDKLVKSKAGLKDLLDKLEKRIKRQKRRRKKEKK